MATLDQLQDALIKADAAGNVDDARAFADEIRKMRGTTQATPEPSMMQSIKQGAGNLAAGAVRGAGSIGATLLAPYDMAKDALDGKGLSLQSNNERRQQIDAGLQSMGAEPESMMYKGGKLAGEIAGTAGVGNALSIGAKGLGAAPTVVNALRTGGMTTGGGQTLGRELATRAGAGALVGGASAGMVSPEDAGMGAAIGGGLPIVGKAVGAGTNALGRLVAGQPQTPELVNAINAARGAGYVIPPTQARPTLTNRLMEGMAGKLTTAQNASAKNAAVTDSLAAKALGLPQDVKITPDVLSDIRKTAGQAYEAIGNSGTITPSANYQKALDNLVQTHLTAAQGFPNAKASPVIDMIDSLRSPSFDASAAVAKIKELRTAADDAFRNGNTDIARASKGAAKAMEDAVEEHLKTTGSTQLLNEFKQARELIAKTYTVEKAYNPTTGTVDARKLGAMLKKGKPITGELKQAGEFANRFPKAANTVEGMGSLPQTSPLDWALGGSMSMATANPLAMASVLARPTARGAILSNAMQNRLIAPQGNNALANLLNNQQAEQLIYRAAPVLSAQ